MRKIAIFTEGQTESIFTRHLLLNIVDASKMCLDCIELLKHKPTEKSFSHQCPEPEVYFLIVDAHGDAGVVSAIREREKELLSNSGYEKIIGIRDLYCRVYKELSPGKINDEVSSKIIEGISRTISFMVNHEKIEVFYAVMEIEAWFLAMYRLMKKINSLLTIEYIHQQLKYDIKKIDPQISFYKPSEELRKVLKLCNINYDKKKDEVESIMSKISVEDYRDAVEGNRTENFGIFYNEIKRLAGSYAY